MKYLIGDHKTSGYFDVLVFSEQISHVDVAKSLPKEYKSFSAGFVSKQVDGSWGAHGRSESMDLGGQEIDSFLLTSFLRDGLSGLDLMNRLALFEIQQRKAVAMGRMSLPPLPTYRQVPKKRLEEAPMSEEELSAHAVSLEKVIQKSQEIEQPE